KHNSPKLFSLAFWQLGKLAASSYRFSLAKTQYGNFQGSWRRGRHVGSFHKPVKGREDLSWQV
ncbi:hypothetical protein PspLS_05916, partial [Pyricularia sp. CBS 133598]